MRRQHWSALAIIAAFILIVIAGSTGLGERSLRPYDIVPLTGASLIVIITMLLNWKRDRD